MSNYENLDGYQVYDTSSKFGSGFGPTYNLINSSWNQSILQRQIEEKVFVVIGYNETFNTLLVARPESL